MMKKTEQEKVEKRHEYRINMFINISTIHTAHRTKQFVTAE